jgi:hypothetical protein
MKMQFQLEKLYLILQQQSKEIEYLKEIIQSLKTQVKKNQEK